MPVSWKMALEWVNKVTEVYVLMNLKHDLTWLGVLHLLLPKLPYNELFKELKNGIKILE